MNQPTVSATTKTGTLSIPEHLRRADSFFQHGAKLQILEEAIDGDPGRVRVQLDGREINLERRFVVDS